MKKLTHKHTIFACFIGYISQAIIVNFAPLLFLTFSETYEIPLEQITLLITINFVTQLLTDLLASEYIQKIGYRRAILLAHICCALGLVCMAVLPDVINSFAGLLISTMIYAVGGGLLEVLVSPIVESCPSKNKAGIMSLLHSFYCWGVVATILLSTAFFVFVGIERWRLLACLFALVPFLNVFFFSVVPLYPIGEEENDAPNYKKLFSQKIFWLMLIMMVCSGASELAVAQWASSFAESALAVDKTTGDLLGACGFAVTMGIARVLYARFSEKIPMKYATMACSVLCIVSYLIIGLSPYPVLALIGCILCGFSVGIFWPGTFSLATESVKFGGTTMFALLALSGDLGCSSGPTVAGWMASLFGGNLRHGILCAVIFPVILLCCLFFLKDKPKNV
ncbi:MAG: MFS transporter [Clostridia bacterium]|nr:MFS transporter [Clostridia bacterium]